jgi:hypothetical protein
VLRGRAYGRAHGDRCALPRAEEMNAEHRSDRAVGARAGPLPDEGAFTRSRSYGKTETSGRQNHPELGHFGSDELRESTPALRADNRC